MIGIAVYFLVGVIIILAFCMKYDVHYEFEDEGIVYTAIFMLILLFASVLWPFFVAFELLGLTGRGIIYLLTLMTRRK